MALDDLKAGMLRAQAETILRSAGLTILPAAQNYDHIMRGDRILESPNGHPLRIDFSAGLTDSSIQMIKAASGYSTR